MRRIIGSVILMLLPLTMMAAQQLDLRDITRGVYRADGMRAVKPSADGESYTQMSSDYQRIVRYSFKTGKETETLFDVKTATGAKLESIDDYIMSPDGRRMLIQTETSSIYRHSFTANYYIYTIASKKLVPLSKNGAQQTPLFSPDGTLISFVRDNNIFLIKLLYDNAESQVTKDGRKNEVINGIPDWVNEEEFSNDRAVVFSADSKQLLWVRYDEKAVREYSMPLYKGLVPECEGNREYPGAYTYKYPVAGADNAQCSVWSFDIASRQTRQLQVPLDADGYIPRIKATGDATKVLVLTMNRHQDCLRVYMVNPLSTVSQLLIEDKTAKYVKEECVDHFIVTDKYMLLPSERNGWMHLYLYNMNGQLLRQVEQGDYEVSEVYGVDDQTGDVYYASHEQGATDQRVYVAHANGKRTCLTDRAGWNTALFSSNYKYFIHSWSNLQTPPVITLCNGSGKALETLVDNKALQEKLAQQQLGTRELFTLTTSEGVRLNGWIVKPADFSPSKRYPVIMYQYSGPGSQQVRDAWNIGMNGQGAILEQYLCQQGFVCVCVDGRGTGGRGADFEKCTYLRLGELESRDQVEAALWLGQQSYVDKDRIAIWGWSYGGFNTLMSMSEGRPVFRAGIAIAPVTSWRFYDTIYTERFMRTPKENPSGYDQNPISRVGQLQGALLLCHGSADDNVHLRNAAEYTEALVQADKDFSQLVYTNRNHSIYGGNTRNHLFRQCVNFFVEKVKR
ncbi:MAG: S9 family peptidase [Prevotella sp.]|nr:S9 family peptidase [Prevotella sp.]